MVDFYCSAARLAIEIDGISHDMSDRPQRDMRRDAWLKQQDVTVLRVAAVDVTHRYDQTIDAIFRMAIDLASRAPSPALRAVPLPRDAGEDGPDAP